MRSRADLFPAEPQIEAFLTNLAVQGNVAAATQNQAMNAPLQRILNHAMEGRINAVRAHNVTCTGDRSTPHAARPMLPWSS